MSTSAPTIPLATGVKVMSLQIQTNANFPAVYLLPYGSSDSMFLKRFFNFFRQIINGVWKSNINVIQGGVYASATATLASVVATDTVVIGGVTLTCVNSGATSVQFNKGTTDTLTAVNLAAAINALTTVNKVVQASSAAAVVTISCIYPGTIGNLVTTTAGGGTITIAATLTGGTDGTLGNISHGL